MAIVGTAYIKIKAITTDFQKEADKAYEKFFRMVTTGYAIGPALATAVGGISSMVSGLVALGSQIAAALPALIVLPSVFSAIGQAAITAKMAFGGIGAAMKALTKKSGGGGGNSKQVEQAEKRLTQVLESNREALVRADDRLTEAEERLTKARIDAAESLQQLGFDAEDAAISEKKAAIELEKARETLARVQDLPPNSRARREAELAYQEADLNMRRAKDSNADLAKETEKRNKLGVEGSEEVVDATKAVQEAVDARAKAELEALRALTDAQEALNDAKKGSGGGGADDEALSKLSAEARAFAEYLVSIKPKLQELKHAAGRELFGPMTFALDNIVKNLFPALIPILEKTGAALGKSAMDFSNIVTAEDNLKNLKEVASTNIDTVGKLGTVFGNLYDVFLTVLSAADPLIRRFTDWLVTLTTGWKEANELDKKSGSLADTFKYAGDIAAQLGRALGKNGLFGAIMNIGKAASGPGSGGEMLLDTFEKSMKKFDEFTAKMLGDGSLEKFFLDASDNFAKISTLAVDLVKEFLKLGDDPAIGDSAEALGGFAPIIGEIFAILQEAGPYLADFVVKLGKFIRLFTESESIKMFFGTLELALDVLIAIFSNPIIQRVALFTAAILGVAKAFHLMGKVGKFAMLLVSKYTTMATSIATASKKAFAALKFEMFRVQYYFVTLSTPVLLAVAAIVALVAIFYLAYKNSEKLRNALKELYEKVLAKIIEVFNEVKEVLEEVMASMGSTEGVGETFKNIFKAIGDFLAKYFVPILEKTLLPLISAVGNAFKGIIYIIGAVIKYFQAVYEFIRGVFSLITGDVDGAKEHFGKSFSAISKAFEFAFKAIKEIFLAVFNVLRGTLAPLIIVLTKAFNVLLTAWKFIFKVIWAVAKQVFDWIVSYIKLVLSIWKAVFTTIGMVFSEIWNGIKIAFDIVWGAVTGAISIGVAAVTAIFETIGMVFSDVWNGISTVFATVWGSITGPIGEVFGFFKEVFSKVKDFVLGVIQDIVDAIVNLPGKLLKLVSTVKDGALKIGQAILDGFIDGLSTIVGKAANFASAIGDAVFGAVKAAWNFFVDGINKLVPNEIDIPGPWNIELPDNPFSFLKLAKGGIVPATRGGSMALIGEAGRAERVEPLDPDGLSKRDKAMITLLSGGKGSGITMNVYPSPGMNETELAAKISRELAFQLRRGAA